MVLLLLEETGRVRLPQNGVAETGPTSDGIGGGAFKRTAQIVLNKFVNNPNFVPKTLARINCQPYREEQVEETGNYNVVKSRTQNLQS